MYTMHGLKMFVESDLKQIPVQYFKDAIGNLEEFLEGIKKGLDFLEKTFNKTIPIDTERFEESIRCFKDIAERNEKEVDREVFINAYEEADKALSLERLTFSTLKDEFKNLGFEKLEEPKYFALKANSTAFHQLGFLNRSFDDFITVKYESEDYYMGLFWYSNFFDVVFRKSDVRELTKEEKIKENIKI